MIDVGVDSGVQMQTADVGIDNTPKMLDAETNMKKWIPKIKWRRDHGSRNCLPPILIG
ncbi:uncharacterized protein PHALS_05887 [Plasmopara halstedii]|uniref:Uncharacterized protein n=1 Tax=Plasmopara halstedii TaxID=4781 RepID=A0A0P1ABG2_PLAHL|nr:uncharacterized protein PHALS_05887 [Plasmopara halstedii]CEG37834.1 hypothetical protein PHALS_05887 [Plasmopara halstedii]|eukprot:XP_024574203.1 hypothetical protein PHALS_05887 [Plasmopara halstedii]